MAIIKSTSARRTSTVKSATSKSASSKTAASKSTSSTSSGTLNSNGYRDNFDYSAAIAGTTDSAKRQQLLSERQNKIDSLGLGGKVASNDAVSTWNGTYRPYSVSSTTTGANRVSSLYDAAENARFKRFETARQPHCKAAGEQSRIHRERLRRRYASDRHQCPTVRGEQRGKAGGART